MDQVHFRNYFSSEIEKRTKRKIENNENNENKKCHVNKYIAMIVKQ